jgi:hypothetical protein
MSQFSYPSDLRSCLKTFTPVPLPQGEGLQHSWFPLLPEGEGAGVEG